MRNHLQRDRTHVDGTHSSMFVLAGNYNIVDTFFSVLVYLIECTLLPFLRKISQIGYHINIENMVTYFLRFSAKFRIADYDANFLYAF